MTHENDIEKLAGTVSLIGDDELNRILTNIVEELNKFKDMVKNIPNDMELGREIRKTINTNNYDN